MDSLDHTTTKGIYGIGVDIQDIATIKGLVEREDMRFVNKVFTEEEIIYCQSKRYPAQHYCARFCAKEALFKALGTGFGNGYSFTDINCINQNNGGPILTFQGNTAEIINEKNLSVMVSLSHSENYAVANVILQVET